MNCTTRGRERNCLFIFPFSQTVEGGKKFLEDVYDSCTIARANERKKLVSLAGELLGNKT